MLDELRHRIEAHTPQDLVIDQSFPEAAVLLPITQSRELVLTLRATGLSTHSGEVAFPGGRRDPDDVDLIHTALREAEEEIALPPSLVDVVGPLSTLVSRHGIKVKPYVGFVPDFVEYKPNDGEIAAVFQVPLEFFRDDPREVTHRIDYFGRSWYVPSYRFGDYKIWGLSAIMVVELINTLFDARIDLHQAPERFISLG
ncbi:MAG: putative Nudix hydrolase NudL [Pseudomonas citronellolis]|nr:MAG: putative Nudix hydrolase NudL [Pseudomonas citronellolis]